MTHAEQVAPQQTEAAYVVEFRQAFEAAIASRLFTGDESVVRKATKALAIPDPDARFRKQFKDVAIRNLLKRTPKDANGNVPYPTDEAINAEVERLLTNLKAKKDKAA